MSEIRQILSRAEVDALMGHEIPIFYRLHAREFVLTINVTPGVRHTTLFADGKFVREVFKIGPNIPGLFDPYVDEMRL